MIGVRRALLGASVSRQSVMAINLGVTLIMARPLAPGEYGASVLAGAVLGMAEAIRALGGSAYLIQKQELNAENIRTSFTIS